MAVIQFTPIWQFGLTPEEIAEGLRQEAARRARERARVRAEVERDCAEISAAVTRRAQERIAFWHARDGSLHGG